MLDDTIYPFKADKDKWIDAAWASVVEYLEWEKERKS